MGNLNFNEQGYLTPYDLIAVEWSELEEIFVFSHIRAKVFVEFKKLVQELSNIGIKNFEIWIDGSFASLKANPNDMDLVCLIDHIRYQEHLETLTQLRDRFSLLDIYFLKQYPVDHSSYFLTNFDKLDWLHFFTRDRRNEKKGILKLIVAL